MKKLFQFSAMPLVLLAYSFLIFTLCYYGVLMSKLIFEWLLVGRGML